MAVYLPSSERIANWTPGTHVGVPGGIAQYQPGGASARTNLRNIVAEFGADPTGVSNSTTAIQNAINAAAEGDVIYSPNGDYRLNTGVSTGLTKKNITFRGESLAARWMYYGSSGACLQCGTDADYLWTRTPLTITGSPAKGATVLSVADTSGWSYLTNAGVGHIVQIAIDNDPALPVISSKGFGRRRTMKTRVTAITSTTITIFPGLYFDLPSSLNPAITQSLYTPQGFGVETMTINGENSTSGTAMLRFYAAFNSWMHDVVVTKSPNFLAAFNDCVLCEARYSQLLERKTEGPNGAGFYINSSTACLFEDNIIYKIFPHVEMNSGCTGNALLFNFAEENDIAGVMGASINTNHNPHNSYTLCEGNVASILQSDGYFGGESELTIFRNWLHGTSDTTDQFGRSISLNRFARNCNVVGNVLGRTGTSFAYDNNGGTTSYGQHYAYLLGQPNIGNGGGSGTAQLSAGDPWADYEIIGTLTTRTSDSVGVITLSSGTGRLTTGQTGIGISWAGGYRTDTTLGTVSGATVPVSSGSNSVLPEEGTTVQMWPGSDGFQEIDLDVAATTIRKGNWNAADAGIRAGESLGGDTLPESLAYATQPDWWPTSLAWPPVNPFSPVQSYGIIPAGYRWLNGGEDPPDTVDTTAPTPNPSTIASATADSTSQITVVADLAVDAVSSPVEYNHSIDGTFLGWQSSATRVFTGLLPSTLYSFTVRARDSAGNATTASVASTATTDAAPAGNPSPLGNRGTRAFSFGAF